MLLTGHKAALASSFMAAVTLLVLGARQADAATLAEIAKLDGAPREAALVEGAKKEGQVMLYSAMIEDQALRPLVAAFRQKYPFVDAQFWRADTRDLINKTLAEARARSVAADIVEGGGLSPALIRAGVTQSFTTPMLAAYSKDLYDPKGMWAATRLSYFGPAYNTNLIKAADAPKSYQDLLDPKWKGKLAWGIASETGGATMFLTFIQRWLGPEKSDAYIKQLAQQKVINASGSAREVVNKVMAGEFPIALGIFLHHPIISALKGAPVAPITMEPEAENASVMVLLKGAPHPYAATLLIDFILSKAGQEVIRNADYFPADATIESSKSLDPIIPEKAHLSHLFLTEDALFESRGKSLDYLKKYFQN